MEAVNFPEVNVIIGEGQPQYKPLPVHYYDDGQAVCCVKCTDEERRKIAETGEIWLSFMTFGRPFQPFYITADKEDVIIYQEDAAHGDEAD